MQIKLELGPGTRAALDRLTPEQGAAATLEAVQTFGIALSRSAAEHTPVGVGQLRQAWRVVVTQSGSVITMVIRNLKRYAPWVEFGTGIYGPLGRRIFPKVKKALSWKMGRAPSSARGGADNRGRMTVRSIAGMKPRHMFKSAFAATAPQWAEIAGRVIERRLTGAGR